MGTKKLIILLLFVPFFSFGQISELPNDVKGFWTYDSTLKDFNITGTTIQSILPKYIYRFRTGGQFG